MGAHDGGQARSSRVLRGAPQAQPREPARHEPAPLQRARHPRRVRGDPPSVPDHHGLPQPAAGRAGGCRHAPVSAGRDRRCVRDDPFGHRAQDGDPAVTGPYVIGCDVGSQGTNAALYAADGVLLASAYEAYDVSFPHPGWAEQDPRLWTAALHATISRLVKQVPEGPSAVKGLSFGSQLDGMVVCDQKGQPLRAAMIWMDRRAEAQATALAGRLSRADFYRHVGANLDSSHAVFKAMWVRDEEPEVFAEAASLMSPGSYVLREAAGVLAVDYSNASSLALLDPRTRRWSAPILEAAGIDAGMLP